MNLNLWGLVQLRGQSRACTQKQPSPIPPDPQYPPTPVPLPVSWSAIWLLCGHRTWAENTQQLREPPENRYGSQVQSATRRTIHRSIEWGEWGGSTCQQNNGRLPQSRDDTPEWLMVKLIMSSSWLERRASVNTSSAAGTMKVHVAPPFGSLAGSMLRHRHVWRLWKHPTSQ